QPSDCKIVWNVIDDVMEERCGFGRGFRISARTFGNVTNKRLDRFDSSGRVFVASGAIYIGNDEPIKFWQRLNQQAVVRHYPQISLRIRNSDLPAHDRAPRVERAFAIAIRKRHRSTHDCNLSIAWSKLARKRNVIPRARGVLLIEIVRSQFYLRL